MNVQTKKNYTMQLQSYDSHLFLINETMNEVRI
jgi:hypothetical protein